MKITITEFTFYGHLNQGNELANAETNKYLKKNLPNGFKIGNVSMSKYLFFKTTLLSLTVPVIVTNYSSPCPMHVF